MGMTHGDAVVILRTPTTTKEEKLKALKFIFESKFEYDYNCLTKPYLWELVRFMYLEMSKEEVISDKEINESLSKQDVIEVLESLLDNHKAVNAPEAQRVAKALQVAISYLRCYMQ